MLCPGSASGKVGQFALVSYISDPLAHFLDQLRLEITPKCNPHAHVSVLPPRPLVHDLKETIHRVAAQCRKTPSFEITLGDVDMFPASQVIFIGLRQGVSELRSLYKSLNSGPLSYVEVFPYHPHITIAQNIEKDRIPESLARAQQCWAEYRGNRSFRVQSLSFVQQVAPDMWVDVAELDLAVEQPMAISA